MISTCSIRNSMFNMSVSVFSMRLPDTAAVMVGEKIYLECEVQNPTHTVRWFQGGREITANKRYNAGSDGKTSIHQLTNLEVP